MSDFTHFNEQGRAKMVDVGEKPISQRVAVAAARVLVNDKTFELIRSGGMKKGDVLTVAQIAGVMGAKRTPDLIPMCHPILMDGINLDLSLDEGRTSVEIKATVSCDGRTGVEMEALTAVSTATTNGRNEDVYCSSDHHQRQGLPWRAGGYQRPQPGGNSEG